MDEEKYILFHAIFPSGEYIGRLREQTDIGTYRYIERKAYKVSILMRGSKELTQQKEIACVVWAKRVMKYVIH